MLHIGTFWKPLPIIYQQFIKVAQKSQCLSKIEQNYRIRHQGRIKKKNGVGLWSKTLTEKFRKRAREYGV
jgi:hypothetical protein